MDAEQARRRFAAARVARLATVGPDGRPHLVPVTFAVDGDIVLTAVDAKPKRTHRLRRLANIAAHPEVCLLVDHYSDDWDVLWWARADGRAVVRRTAPRQVLELLVGKYPQYRQIRPQGPFVLVDVTTWRGWSAS